MNQLSVAILCLLIMSLACAGSAPATPRTVDEYLKEYGGSRAVYDNIFMLTDCTKLQEQFNIASANNAAAQAGTSESKETTGYMVAADQRMKELDCYSSSSQIIQPSNTVAISTQPIATSTTYFLPTLTKPAASPVPFVPSATATFVFLISTNSPAPRQAVCPCSGDTLNCSDFSTHGSAQACMDYCISIGAGDIHNLDGNANGSACES